MTARNPHVEAILAARRQRRALDQFELDAERIIKRRFWRWYVAAAIAIGTWLVIWWLFV